MRGYHCATGCRRFSRIGTAETRRMLPLDGGRTGFTLIELLLVIALLTILAALLFPVLAAARERARQTRCLSNLRQIARAQMLYLQDWDDRFPHWYFPGPPRPQPFGNFVYWTEFFQPYLHSERVLRCPDAHWIRTKAEAEKLGEYVLVPWGRGGRGTRASPAWNWPRLSQMLSSVPRPAETIALMDGFTMGGWTSTDLVRHRGGANAGFVDGHARWLKPSEFWRVAQDDRGTWFYWFASADR